MVEVRLIDANALKFFVHYQGTFAKGANPVLDALVEVQKAINAAPTIDAVPVVHARWLPRGSDDHDAGMYYCSACKDERYFGDEVFTSEEAEKYCHYCPNCGAKMDGGRDEKD